MIPILDTHLHLLYTEKFHYDWCDDLPALAKDFKLGQFEDIVSEHGLAGSLFMEVDVRESEIAGEAHFFSELAADDSNSLLGVIAACRPESEKFESLLEETLTDKVCGLRRVLHTQPDEISQSSLFRRNLQSLAKRNLPFDLCFTQAQHPIAAELVEACPDTSFVLDHCGVPNIDPADFDAWKKSMQALAEMPNLNCKVSGIIAYCASAEAATLETLRPWIETTVESFGVERCLIGTDYPVCNLTAGVQPWLGMVREFFASFSESEQEAIFNRNAQRVYGISI